MLADLVMLSDSIIATAPEKIRDTKVLRTVVDGKKVFNLEEAKNQ
jgi:predicted amidohydrolase YtcJ